LRGLPVSDTATPTLTEALELIDALEEHLDWCGWGDKWERECSEPLRNKLGNFNQRRGK